MEKLKSTPLESDGLSTINTVPIPILLLDNNLRMSFINEAGMRYFQISSSDQIQEIKFIAYITAASAVTEKQIGELEKYLRSKEKDQRTFNWTLKEQGEVELFIDCVSIEQKSFVQICIYSNSHKADNKNSVSGIFNDSNLLENVIQQSTEAVVVADNDLKILVWNEKSTELLGIGSKSSKTANWNEEYELYEIDTITPFNQDELPLTKAVKFGITTRNCEMYIKKTGMYLSVNATPLYDQNERKIGGMAVLSDITAMKQAELAVKESELKFRTLFENANDGIYIVSRKEGIFKQINKKAVETLGYKKKELIGKSIDLINIPFDKVKKNWIQQEIETSGKVVYEHGHIRKDGQIVPVEISSKIAQYEGDEVIQYHVRDISSRKKAQAEIQRSYKEILFTQNLIQAAEKEDNLPFLTKKITDGLSEIIKPTATRLYDYDTVSQKLSMVSEKMESSVRSKFEALSKVKIKSIVPDPGTNDYIRKLLSTQEPNIISSEKQIQEFIEQHVEQKFLKKLAPKIVKILNIKIIILLPILYGDEVKSIVSFTLSEKPKNESIEAIIRYLKQANNVLKKIRFEKDLKVLNNKYTDLIDNLKDSVISLNKDGQIILANYAAQKLFGYSKTEILKVSLIDLVHPLDRERSNAFYEKLKTSEFHSNFIGRIIAKQGETKYVEISSSAIFDEQKNYLGSRAIVRDITVRKLQERNKHVQQILLENVAKSVDYRRIVQQSLRSFEEVRSGEMLAAVYNYNRIEQSFNLIGANSKKHEAFFLNLKFAGMYPEAVIKENTKGDYARFTVDENEVVDFSNTGYAFPIVSRHLGIRGVIIIFFDTEKEVTNEETDAINAINNILKISIEHHQSKEEIKRFTENLEAAVERRTSELRHEIFERRIIEKELERSKNLAESASNAKTNFLANMSHEIRSPLNAILGFSQIMKGISTKEGFSDKSMTYLDNIEMSSKNLSAIINDILDLSKIESGKLELDNEEFKLEQIIKNVYHINKSAAKDKKINFSYEIDEKLPNYIYGDRTKIMQVLMNLTSNAIKFTPSGKKVKINAQKQSDRLAFHIIDEGIGIDANRLESIFDPFEQEDTSVTREFGGSGLGLAISRSIVNLMNGSITAQSDKSIGSTFKVTIPLIAANPTETKTENQFTNLDSVVFENDFKIVLVEDNVLNQDLVKALMERVNVDLIVANNGIEGIQKVEEHRPNAILMDMHMPGMDGLETIQQIKSNSELHAIPIIAYSADAFAETRKMAYDAGVVDYLTKPLDLNKLLYTLSKFSHVKPDQLDFGNNDERIDTKVDVPEKNAAEFSLKIDQILETPIFESEKLLENLNHLKNYCKQHKIEIDANLKLISDAIYDGNETVLISELEKLK